MPVINMIRGDETAVVDSDHAATYENFLAHGWVNADEPQAAAVAAPEPADEAPVEVPAAHDAAPVEVVPPPAPPGRKKRQPH